MVDTGHDDVATWHGIAFLFLALLFRFRADYILVYVAMTGFRLTLFDAWRLGEKESTRLVESEHAPKCWLRRFHSTDEKTYMLRPRSATFDISLSDLASHHNNGKQVVALRGVGWFGAFLCFLPASLVMATPLYVCSQFATSGS